jgi:hypothetical protein
MNALATPPTSDWPTSAPVSGVEESSEASSVLSSTDDEDEYREDSSWEHVSRLDGAEEAGEFPGGLETLVEEQVEDDADWEGEEGAGSFGVPGVGFCNDGGGGVGCLAEDDAGSLASSLASMELDSPLRRTPSPVSPVAIDDISIPRSQPTTTSNAALHTVVADDRPLWRTSVAPRSAASSRSPSPTSYRAQFRQQRQNFRGLATLALPKRSFLDFIYH